MRRVFRRRVQRIARFQVVFLRRETQQIRRKTILRRGFALSQHRAPFSARVSRRGRLRRLVNRALEERLRRQADF